MVDASENSTDGSSIRPVSSLRSHFERMGKNRPVARPIPSSTSPRSFSHYDQPLEETQTTDRASLDSPRRPSPWSSFEASNVPNPQPKFRTPRTPSTPVSRSQLSPSPLRQRPTSMVSLSPSRSLPTVTVDPPGSPPESLILPKMHLAPRPAFPSNTAPARPKSYNVTSGRSPLPSCHPPFEQLGKHSETSIIKDSKNLPTKQNLYQAPRGTVAKTTPPLVNRAEKPKIPIKPLPGARSSNLELEAVVVDDRLSPFSTPPSSDESPGPVLFKDGEPQSKQPQKVRVKGQKQSCFQESSEHYAMQSGPCGKSSVSAQTSKALGSGANSSPPTALPPSTRLEVRPGLPPRQNVQRVPQRSVVPMATTSMEDRKEDKDLAATRTPASRTLAPNAPKDRTKLTPEFLPPPRRSAIFSPSTSLKAGSNAVVESTRSPPTTRHNPDVRRLESRAYEVGSSAVNVADFPDASSSNRRPPVPKTGAWEIETHYDTRLLDLCGTYVCTTGYLTRAWDLMSGEIVMSIGHHEKEIRVTAMAFKPGATADEEGLRLWLGNNNGDLEEVDITTQSVVRRKPSAHGRREIIKIYRHQNSMWTLDEDGKLYVWPPDEDGLPNLGSMPSSYRVPKGHSFSLTIKNTLWIATGKDIRIFRPNPQGNETFTILDHPLGQPGLGEVTSGATISGQLDRAYFGHADGKVTLYSTVDYSCLGVINVSVYKISSLTGAGSYLWAGYNTGMIYVYDTRTQPWTTKKDWFAHDNPVANILVDRSSVWRSGLMRVASIGQDNAIRLWDGLLEDDWLENDVQVHDIDYCTFREVKAVVVTWNVGAATPANVRHEEKDSKFFHEVLQTHEPPDLLVFGFQELVDLEDKRLTAKSLFKSNKRKDPSEHEHMSRQYREWRDFLVRCIEDKMPSDEPYYVLHTASMVGLFSCVFVKASQHNHIRRLDSAEVKRGMGGLHGNKGALILRFIYDDTSLCLVNCHLAAGQSQTLNRNNDAAAILESTMLPGECHPVTRCDTYIGGGDGSMILDHEICVLKGDLNYRIDTMSRDTVIKAISNNNFEKLLERDQLLVSRRRNPGFRLRAFTESMITFAPTYKYDVGSDKYDTSEKHRAPAWCDRILYRGASKIKQVQYRRHETRVSDHRPVSGTFKMRIKAIQPEKRSAAWKASIRRFEEIKQKLFSEAKIAYLRDILGVEPNEAQALL